MRYYVLYFRISGVVVYPCHVKRLHLDTTEQDAIEVRNTIEYTFGYACSLIRVNSYR